MKKRRFQFGLRFFLFAVMLCAAFLIFIWESAHPPQVFKSNAPILGAMTYGDVESLEELTLSPAQAIRSIRRSRSGNPELRKQLPSDLIWKGINIEPMEVELESPRDFPLIGPAFIRKRDFRCTIDGVDSKGKEVSAIVIVNRNYFHSIEID